MRKATKFGILALLLVSLVGSAFAFSAKGFGNNATKQAIKDNDYTAWKEAKSSELTEDNFNKLHQRYADMSEKKTEMDQKRQDVEAAIESNDYNAWLSAVEGSPGAEKLKETITADNFSRFVEMHNAMKNKDPETAKQIADELGIKWPMGFGGLGDFGKGRIGNKMPCLRSDDRFN
ncbi:MAG: hypothetical protein KKC75_04700 [Nanoarchaeota archaeon]|nr:hypothetical protein [Nanoarchaeota archaeon]MBU1005849.1 hypothetical protein [Nanoarchaeota archaeon]MBU1946107.1 hypothetical protein [Nanoarchaeota archaeon]